MVKTLKDKTEKDLNKTLSESRESLRKVRFSLSGSATRNTQESKNLRKTIAQTLTELNSRK